MVLFVVISVYDFTVFLELQSFRAVTNKKESDPDPNPNEVSCRFSDPDPIIN